MMMTQMPDVRLSRRAILGSFAAAVGAGSVAACTPGSMTTPVRAFGPASVMPLGIQFYMLGAEPYKDLPGTFAKLAEMGYRQVEIPQITVKTAAATAKAAADAGIAITSLHLNSGKLAPSAGLTLDSDPQQIIDTMGILGTKLAVLPMTPLPASAKPGGARPFQQMISEALVAAGRDYWIALAELLNQRAALLAKGGIGLGYHNHNMEFAPVGDTTGWAILVGRTDPKLVHFEVDIGWVQSAGLDPAAFIRALRPRVRQLHLKDVAAGMPANFALETKPTVAGTGVVDWPAVLRAARTAGVSHAYVEQEPPFDIPRMEAARQSALFFSTLTI